MLIFWKSTHKATPIARCLSSIERRPAAVRLGVEWLESRLTPAVTPAPGLNSMALGQQANGALALAAVGATDSNVYFNTQIQPNGATGWTGWQFIGRPGDTASSVKQVAIWRNGTLGSNQGTLEVFARTERLNLSNPDPVDGIWFERQASANSNSWGGWQELAAVPMFTKYITDFAVAQNASGTLEVFAIVRDDSQDQIYSTTQLAPGSDQWGGFNPIGTSFPTSTLSNLVVAQNAVNNNLTDPGALEVFVVRSGTLSNQVWHMAQNFAGGPWGNWTQLDSFPTYITEMKVTQNDASAPNGATLEAFAIGSDNNVYSDTQQSPGWRWGGWSTIVPANPSPASGLTHIAVAINGSTLPPHPNTLEVFVSTSSTVYDVSQAQAGGAWGTWASRGAPGENIDWLLAGQNLNQDLEIFTHQAGSTNTYSDSQAKPGQTWNGWGLINAVYNPGSAPQTSPALASDLTPAAGTGSPVQPGQIGSTQDTTGGTALGDSSSLLTEPSAPRVGSDPDGLVPAPLGSSRSSADALLSPARKGRPQAGLFDGDFLFKEE